MTSPKKDPDAYEPLPIPRIPVDGRNQVTRDIYIYLPTPKKYMLYLKTGDTYTEAKRVSLAQHVLPVAFVKTSDKSKGFLMTADSAPSILDNEVIGPATSQRLGEIFKEIVDLENPPDTALQKLSDVADEIVKAIAPEVEEVRSKFLENTQYLWVMNDAAAITTLAALFAMANGIDSKKSLKDIVSACVVMDLPLSKMGEESIKEYYMDPNKGEKFLEEYKKHPIIAYQLAKKASKHFSETTVDLILNHHELNNSTGFPRHIRSATLSPLAGIFAAAVDTFDQMKCAQYQGKSIGLDKAILSLLEIDKELHQRRHNEKIIRSVLDFMMINPENKKPDESPPPST